MKSTLPNNQTTRSAIQKLLDNKNYVGELTSKGFIIKRNYGVRRQPIYGVFNEQNQIEVQVKNEIIHQIVYIFGLLIMLALSVFALLQGIYIVTLLTLIIGSLVFASDRHQKKKELKELLANLER